MSDFRVVKIKRVPPKPDGSPRRNSFTVELEVDGLTYDVRIRRLSGAAKLPPELLGHPQAGEIRTVAQRAPLEVLRARMEVIRPDPA